MKKKKINDTQKVGSLSVDELRTVIRESGEMLFWELEAHLPDPDEGLTLKPELEQELMEELKQPLEELRGKSLQEIMREMGLED